MRGIRFRATAFVTILLAVALLVGGVILTSVLRNRLTENLDATITAATNSRVASLEVGAEPQALLNTQLSEALVWIGTADGQVLGAGGYVLIDAAPVGTTPGTRTVTVPFSESHGDSLETEIEPLRVHVASASSPTYGELVVVVGSQLEAVDGPVGDVARVLLIGSPLILILVAGLTWVTADRALSPVGSIRADAQRISTHAPGSTIAVPETGDEIEALAVTVNDMLDRLARNDARQREFVGDASHELKSPLANLRIDVETSDIPTETRIRQLGQIDRLTAIVDDLLALARNDENQPLERSVIDLDDIVFDVLSSAAPGHDRRVDIDAVAPTRVSADAGQLNRLVRNLVDNATRHADTTVAIALFTDGADAVLHVDDDGPGVPAAIRAQIFERFGRPSEARGRHDGGTGLGLAIVQQVAERHGGTVEVTDSPIGGARFTVCIPTDA